MAYDCIVVAAILDWGPPSECWNFSLLMLMTVSVRPSQLDLSSSVERPLPAPIPAGPRLQALTTRCLDLAIIEPRLPDISGFELAESIAGCNIPVLLINGHPNEQISCKFHGYPHLDKPFRLAALANAAQHALRNAAENIAIIHRSYATLLSMREEQNRIVSELSRAQN